MKKTWIGALALMMILTALCTACGPKADDTPAAEATELPSVTAPPANGETGETGLAADDNNAPELLDPAAKLANMGPEQRKAEELKGALVEELYKAIGEPQSAEYTTSCLVENGEDGILTYEGFLVATTRYPNGEEYVMGTSN